MYLCGYRGDIDHGDGTPRRGPMLGPKAQRQADFEASLAPGCCRICKYMNQPSDHRCQQCGNTMG